MRVMIAVALLVLAGCAGEATEPTAVADRVISARVEVADATVRIRTRGAASVRALVIGRQQLAVALLAPCSQWRLIEPGIEVSFAAPSGEQEAALLYCTAPYERGSRETLFLRLAD